ncbi:MULTISPECIES: TatD family hydrolase [Pelosinus]|uniref:Hydrolase, TatD family n=1 Tax=Pelosinus fermentans B4 TaxID=1149862 RepID=I9L690_9FIRM|nr:MULTISPECIES: TatD family hydrolase [Pelosinus]EIW15869.1 hydrolase, TatD family [Pelosinus fermentans B4]EIW27425.1 hydrolase, TatD family [Pelosinus fermentans A11]OAM92618.1 hydrolase, TatD family [Pelosinus fermentans DSM 17108]SDQ51090.1 TatD DNase family protein [Pelosinus fermentans]
MLFDSHAHIDDEKFDIDREEVIQRAIDNGVTGIINVGASMESSARSIALAEKYEGIYAAVGIHPHDAKDALDTDYEQLVRWTALDKVVAIGEIGLDYYYDFSPREVQRSVFIHQLDVARQTNMPFIIHDRDAHGDVLEILKKEAKGLKGVLHCFSGSLEMANEVIKMGLYVSIAGPVTFKNAAKLPEIVTKVPLEYLLVETDSPYLTPQPYRGKRNEPAYVKLVAEQVANLRGIELDVLAKATSENVKRLFGIS